MPIKVVDASALGALVFNEPAAPRIASELQDAELTAPKLLRFELASICLKKIRTHPEQRDLLVTAYSMAHRLDISYSSVDFEKTIDLAEKTNLTLYDACYLWLANKLGAKLVTLDKQLLKQSDTITKIT